MRRMRRRSPFYVERQGLPKERIGRRVPVMYVLDQPGVRLRTDHLGSDVYLVPIGWKVAQEKYNVDIS